MIPYHSIITPPDIRKRKKTIEAVPDEVLVDMSARLFALMNLTWDYVDTILDICISLRISETKPLVRIIRNLKREYDKFRWSCMTSTSERDEQETGLEIEEKLSVDFNRLFNGVEHEVNKLGLSKEHKMLVIATQQALTLMDAVKIYARRCDKKIASYDVWVCDCCMVQTDFMKLYPLIPQFAGDCYQPNLNARKLSAGIIANKLQDLELEGMKRYMIKD
ncbi:MAG: hypothetical protein K2N88_02560 [Muribaculaceae bacterium]|nr:hypothetical protein [Muribaculaceae bacterium]